MSNGSHRRSAGALLFAAVTGVSLAACSSDEGEGALPTSPVESGFSVARDAFSFANFAGPDLDSQLTAESVARMFGDAGTCASRDDGVCRATLLASAWIDAINQSMGGGRCEGFAVLSGLFFLGIQQSGEFGAADPHALSLAGNPKLGGELAYWFSSQFLPNLAKKETRARSAKEAVAFLADALKGRSDLYRVGIVRYDAAGRRRGGHALLPYAVVPKGGGKYAIKVYDNNHPNEERAIAVDVNEDRWSYVASSNPDDPEALYTGDRANRNPLYLAPIKPRLGVQGCPFCGTDAQGQEALNEIFTFGSADGAVVAPDGRASGVVDGKIASDLADVSVVPSFSDTLSDDAPVMLLAPASQEARVAVRATGGAEPSSVAMIGQGYAASASDLSSVPGALDHVTFASRAGTVRLEPGSPGRAMLRLVRSTSSGAQLSVSVRPSSDGTSPLTIGGNDGSVTVQGDGPLELSIVRSSSGGDAAFEGTVDVPAGGSVDLDLAGWAGPGSPIGGVVHTPGQPDQPITIEDASSDEPPPPPPPPPSTPRSCKELMASGPKPASGPQTIDVDGPAGLAPFTAYCDFETDGGGWTIVAAYTGGDGEVPMTSDTEVSGDPLAFEHMNISQAKKMALAAISAESLFKRGDGAWLQANAPLYDETLATPGSETHVSVTIRASSGEIASAVMGFATSNIAAGGDFGITGPLGFDHTTPDANHVNNMCDGQYLYSYSQMPDGDAGWDVNLGLGAWSATQTCLESETGHLAIFFAMR